MTENSLIEKMSSKTDTELVILSLEDNKYFSFLITRYKQKINKYIKRITAFSDDRIEDILQEVFIKTYLNLNGFNKDLSFSAWIYRIAHNEAVSFYRKNKKHIDAVNLIDDEDLEIFASETDIEKEFDSNQLKNILAETINELSEKYKSVLVLKFIEGRSYDEISDILQKPPGTIATWINRAKKDLRKKLDKKGIKHYE